MFDFSLASLVAKAPAILLGLALHEYAHAKAATMLGDPTPRYEGRLTMNPLPHLDVIGTLMLIIAPIGWAKPVNVNPYNFRGDPKRGMMYVSLAGPAMNIFLALISMVLFVGFYNHPEMNRVLQWMIIVNISLAVFNMLPIPPLDGSKVLAGLLPYKHLTWMGKVEQYGPLILIIAVVTGIAQMIIRPLWIIVHDGFVSPVGRFIGSFIFF
ncbi:site-2 protease family protein [Heliorestis acidaminivorans]|uniref:Site-2 protease family protein n=1 Tax=Heliorestis acidaminivorans TaxID=553427 RepID=A0A6I0F2N5_9FIRM|nr:site-2 protease family protein [Heliorestis acidaminivorans]KAB2952618.1 site-2 protease family protein [Heliorestis acidaminivorans]